MQTKQIEKKKKSPIHHSFLLVPEQGIQAMRMRNSDGFEVLCGRPTVDLGIDDEDVGKFELMFV